MALARRDREEIDANPALAEAPEHTPADARRLGHRHPVEILRLHHDRRLVTRLGVFERPARYLLPDSIIAILVLLAFAGGTPKNALFEPALVQERGMARLELPRAQIALTAGPAELQHQGFAVRPTFLRPVMDAFGKIADLALVDGQMRPDRDTARDAIADLVEIVPVARRIIFRGLMPDRPGEIVRRAFLAGKQVIDRDTAMAMRQRIVVGPDRIRVNDLHDAGSFLFRI